ncbi:MAG: hypothetical protein AB7G28_14170 [Pirellulales bacterium]
MLGGQDKGFAFSYFKLSYRRKLIRTAWTSIVAIVFGIVVLLTKPESIGFAVGLIVIAAASGLIQGAYNYYRWKSEEQATVTK